MALIKCKECGESISSSAPVCPHCGFKNEMILCPECGKEINSADAICPQCGCPLRKKSANNIIAENLDKITGAKSESYIKFRDLFKNTFKKHTEEEIDDVFVCGTKSTTPDINDINPKNVGAWVYFKIFIFFLIAYIPTRIGFIDYGNINFLPAMVMLAAFAMPVTVLIFFFEINVFKNIPFYKVMKYFVLGGALSLIIAILYFSLPYFEANATLATYWGALMIGLVEEAAKAVVVAIFIFKSKKCNYILNGLLVGAAVGAGFAAFETAGYILKFGLSSGIQSMLGVIKLRGFLAPGGHVAWAAIEGAALMHAKGFEKINKKHLNDKRFLLVCLIPVVLHGIWDMPINAPYYSVQIVLTVLAWIVIIYFINLGLKQVDDAKKLKNSVMQSPMMQNPIAQSPVIQSPIMQNSTVSSPIVQNPVPENPVADDSTKS